MTYSLNALHGTDRSIALTGAAARADMPSGLRRVLRESSLFIGLVLWAFWLLAMLSHHPGDAAWSTSGVGEPVRNWAGRLGAWLSDASYYTLGFSVWWLLAAWARVWLAGLGRWLREGSRPSGVAQSAAGLWGVWARWRLSRWAWGLGLIGLVTASCALEWSRLYRWEPHLPGHAGGVLGYGLGPLGTQWLGSTGLALLCIGLGVLCASWVFRFSWAGWAEGLGRRVDGWLQSRRDRRERAHDEQLGREAARAREAAADGPAPPLLAPATEAPIAAALTGEPAWAHALAPVAEEGVPPWEGAPAASHAGVPNPSPPPVAAPRRAGVNIEPVVKEVAQSNRAAQEKQTGLFSELDAVLPTIDLLDTPLTSQEGVSHETLEMTSRLIEKKLKDFGVQVAVVAAYPGPVITRYEIEPATGVKGSQVVGLARDLARSLSLVSIRVVETIPGKNCMALELPNARRQTIRLSEILGSQVYHKAKSLLTMGLGKDIVGNPVVADLGDMPHCLVAGTTGSGKSVGINAMILSILYKAEPRDVRFLMIDPKMLEMSVYEGIPHLLAPVVTDMKQAAHGLNWCVAEMERRYKLLSKLGVRKLSAYNDKVDDARARGEFIYNPFSLTPDSPEPLQRLPHIVIVIDELADLMMVVGKKIEELIARLAQKARAAGIHLVLATQRPSVDVITGLIKANVPTRISFQVSSKIDSRTILDEIGAEALLGMGDMLYKHKGTVPVRVHGCFVSDEEVIRVVGELKSRGEPDYIEGVLQGGTLDGDDNGGGGSDVEVGEQDPNYDRAVQIVLENKKASISLVQRHLGIGYNKAANLLDAMEKAGLVSPMNARGQREILVPGRTD